MRGDKAVAGLLFRGPSEQVSHMFQLSQRRSISLAVRWDEVICLAANILGGSHGKEFGRLYYFLMLQSKLPQIQGLNATQFIILSLGFCKLEVLAWLLRVFCSRFCSQAEIWGLIKGSPRGRAASRKNLLPHIFRTEASASFSRLPSLHREGQRHKSFSKEASSLTTACFLKPSEAQSLWLQSAKTGPSITQESRE